MSIMNMEASMVSSRGHYSFLLILTDMCTIVSTYVAFIKALSDPMYYLHFLFYRRPLSVCWCPFLPKTPISIKTQVIVLQHRYEVRAILCAIVGGTFIISFAIIYFHEPKVQHTLVNIAIL